MVSSDRPLGQTRRAPRDPQAVSRGPDLTPAQTMALRARQKLRNRVLFLLLVALVGLFFAITVSRMSQLKDLQTWSRPGGLPPVPTVPSR